MLQSYRYEQIISYLLNHDYLTVDQAVNMFQASPATVRRDFSTLAQNELVKRERGLLRLRTSKIDGLSPFALRQIQYSEEKAAIAQKATSLVKPGQVIFIDGGTTTFHMGLHLAQMQVKIITNSLRLAVLLEEKRMENSDMEIYLAGGFIHSKSGILIGPNTEESLRHYHAECAFLSAGGISPDGIFNTNDLVVKTEQVMIENAQQVIILADHSKFGKHAMSHVCSLDKIDVLITDAPDQILQQYQGYDIKFIRAGCKSGE